MNIRLFNTKKQLFVIATVLVTLLLVPLNVSAGSAVDDDQRNAACESFTGSATDCGESTGVTALVASALNILSFIVGAASLIFIVVGGIRYVISNGDAQQIAGAKNTILYAIIGLVIALAGQGIVRFVLDAV